MARYIRERTGAILPNVILTTRERGVSRFFFFVNVLGDDAEHHVPFVGGECFSVNEPDRSAVEGDALGDLVGSGSG